jgi:hypothetical protein
MERQALTARRRQRPEDFAAEAPHRSDFNFMPVEGRLYFGRKQGGEAPPRQDHPVTLPSA